MSIIDIVAVTIASFAAGYAIAGGGGLVTLPVLLAIYTRASAATLFGTNKTCMVWGTLWAARAYVRRVSLPWKQLSLAVLAGFAGGCLGAFALTIVSGQWVRQLLPLMLAVVFVQTLLQRRLGAVHAPPHTPRGQAARAALMAGGLGLYDGFFGPGTGSFLIFLLVKWLGYDFLHAAAAAKVLNAATNLGALAVFARLATSGGNSPFRWPSRMWQAACWAPISRSGMGPGSCESCFWWWWPA